VALTAPRVQPQPAAWEQQPGAAQAAVRDAQAEPRLEGPGVPGAAAALRPGARGAVAERQPEGAAALDAAEAAGPRPEAVPDVAVAAGPRLAAEVRDAEAVRPPAAQPSEAPPSAVLWAFRRDRFRPQAHRPAPGPQAHWHCLRVPKVPQVARR
jgi:hypothetical protein